MRPEVVLLPDRFEQIGMFIPKPVKTPAVEKRWLLFVRVEVLTAG